jgi:hypothetical protein
MQRRSRRRHIETNHWNNRAGRTEGGGGTSDPVGSRNRGNSRPFRESQCPRQAGPPDVGSVRVKEPHLRLPAGNDFHSPNPTHRSRMILPHMLAQGTDTDERQYFSTIEASKILCSLGLPTAPSTLSKLRCIGGGPRFLKFGRKPVYTQKSLQDWVTSKLSAKVSSTSEL